MAADERRGLLDPLYTEYAGVYDERTIGTPGDIDFYRELAQEADRPVVELGVGTGRIAIPTVRAGVPVLGLDLSPLMLAIARTRRWRWVSARTWGWLWRTCAGSRSPGRRR